MPVRFDESLRVFVDALGPRFDAEALARSVFLRDATGYLSVVVPVSLDMSETTELERHLRSAVQGYLRPIRPISGLDAPGSARLMREARRVEPVLVAGHRIVLLDRRALGGDWLTPPAPSTTAIPRFVFSSLKGGVGRSTALSVIAAHLSAKGQRVLAIDLDLEAPGIGTMLLKEDELPLYGTLDYLVENGISGIDATFVADAVGNSYLGSRGARVAVVPAIGKATLDNPEGALAKLSRAYLDDVQVDGDPLSLGSQIKEMVGRFESTSAFDVVLVDARAGLHETTATAISGLGADVFLFGIDEPQTYLGYRLLLSHLARFKADPNDDWRERLHFVQAKSGNGSDVGRMRSLADLLFPVPRQPNASPQDLSDDDFDLDWVDEGDPGLSGDALTAIVERNDRGTALSIFQDPRFQSFDPVATPDLMTEDTYRAPFAELLDFIDSILEDREDAT